MDRYRGIYRIPSNRMPVWDYAGNGSYFITLVVQHQNCVFGRIKNQNMICNEWGIIATTAWFKSFEIRQKLTCDAFVLMPNHLHAILRIFKPVDIVEIPVKTHGRASLREMRNELPSFERKPKSLSSFVAGYKSAVTTQINNWIDQQLGNEITPSATEVDPQYYEIKFSRHNRLWQPNYHDHIIRNATEYKRIATYILDNPANWSGDKFYGC